MRILPQETLEEALGSSLIAALLQQDVKFGTMLVDGTPQQIRLTADVDEDLVQMPGRACFTRWVKWVPNLSHHRRIVS